MKVYKQSIDFNSLGNLCKSFEKTATQEKLIAGIPIVARLDGHSFSKFCKGLEKPYDIRLNKLMQDTARYLLEKYNADLAYTQSDEISLVWMNQSVEKSTLFNGKKFKLTSLLASSAVGFFIRNLDNALPEKSNCMPEFDCRIWNVPNLDMAAKTILWREMDATRNSISMAGQANFSHKSLQGVNTNQIMDKLINEKGINWNDYPNFFKKGTYFSKVKSMKKMSEKEMKDLPEKHNARKNPHVKFCRSSIQELDILPLLKIDNKVETLFPLQIG